jgi:hypothetical protein
MLVVLLISVMYTRPGEAKEVSSAPENESIDIRPEFFAHIEGPIDSDLE